MPSKPVRMLSWQGLGVVWLGVFLVIGVLLGGPAWGQDASSGAIRGTVADASGGRLPNCRVEVVHSATGWAQRTQTDEAGGFVVSMLPPGEYAVRVAAAGMAVRELTGVRVEVGGQAELQITLAVAGVTESVTVAAEVPEVETQTGAASSVVDARAIIELPLDGRRFSDLALLTPGVTQDPRSQTSDSQGDLSFGGIRGFQNSFLVDGTDDNNGFFSQERGRYRAPYQFSNDVIQEFRIFPNTYGVEHGRSGGAVINVVTRSGTNQIHGTGFYYVRDSALGAEEPTPAGETPLSSKPAERQQQFGGTLGGPIVKDRAFYYVGFDQHIFHIPQYVQFVNGKPTITPMPACFQASAAQVAAGQCTTGTPDYEPSDQAQVRAAAQQLTQMGGVYPSSLVGNAGFAKIDYAITPRQQLSLRLSTSRFWGDNNYYFDPGSPITHYAQSNNGSQNVTTESASLSLTSALGFHATSHLRVQYARDLQDSSSNSSTVGQKVYGVIDGFGRSDILPGDTDENRVHVAETLQIERRRHSWKFGGDALLTRTRDYFPGMFGGEYDFDTIKVNPFTFAAQRNGMTISPLRAYAHDMPRYYLQDFGNAVSQPGTNEYAAFLQDTVRLTNRFALTLGVRYDVQAFSTAGPETNPLWPMAGKLPLEPHNFAPRAGFAYSFGGDRRPLVLRGGWGMFYTRIPSIYAGAVADNNGINSSQLFMDNYALSYASMAPNIFPSYPAPLVSCPPGALTCTAPAGLGSYLTSNVSAFASNFQTPYVEQANLGVEREVGRRVVVSVNYQYVHGVHLVRAMDANLPSPVNVQYPVMDPNNNFTGQFDTVPTFSTMTASMSCPRPPCLIRPIPQLGAIDQFDSTGSSVYHGMTVSVRRRMASGLYFRVAYTWSHAIDDTQDALLTTTSTIQNSYDPAGERGNSVTDQRHRLVVAWVAEPRPIHGEHPLLRALLNDWKASSVATVASGRPFSVTLTGDPNGDGNIANDRLPGVPRDSLTGPGYANLDLRLARKFHLSERVRVELLAECFNLMNHDNRRIISTGNGYAVTGADFVPYSITIPGVGPYSGYIREYANALTPTGSYAPRQLQFALRLHF